MGICCARCNQPVSSSNANSNQPVAEAQDPDEFRPDNQQEASPSQPLSSQPPVNLNDWELEDDLHAVERLVEALNAKDVSPQETTSPAHLDAGHNTLAGWHVPIASSPVTENILPSNIPAAPEKKPRRRSTFFSWTFISLGLMTFVCGGVLLGWSFVASRAELWTIGMPLTLVGQAALIVGLVLQLEGLWQSNRDTTSTLDELDQQLRDLRHATTLLSSTHSTSAKSFYAHMAEGASPQLLLTDLKGQLDMLATRIAQERR